MSRGGHGRAGPRRLQGVLGPLLRKSDLWPNGLCLHIDLPLPERQVKAIPEQTKVRNPVSGCWVFPDDDQFTRSF